MTEPKAPSVSIVDLVDSLPHPFRPSTPEGWLRYVYDHVTLVPALARALYLMRTRGMVFDRRDLGLYPSSMHLLERDGIITPIPTDSGFTLYDAASLDAAMRTYVHQRKQAQELQRFRTPRSIELPDGVPQSIFSDVIGFNDLKLQLKLILASPSIHGLLEGPPASAKSMCLDAIADLPGARMIECGKGIVTGSGLRTLLSDTNPRWLLIDEIDKAESHETDILLGIMTRGQLTVTISGQISSQPVTCQIFAAGNDVEKRLPRPLLSRFQRLKFPAYTPEEFIRISFTYLRRRGYSVEVSRIISQGLSVKTKDVRSSVRIAELSKGDPAMARFLVKQEGEEARV